MAPPIIYAYLKKKKNISSMIFSTFLSAFCGFNAAHKSRALLTSNNVQCTYFPKPRNRKTVQRNRRRKKDRFARKVRRILQSPCILFSNRSLVLALSAAAAAFDRVKNAYHT